MIKTIKINWDSFDEVNKTLSMLKSRKGELQKTHLGIPSKKERNILVFEACQNIFNADISAIYSDLKLDTEPKYYVYSHLNTGWKIAINKHGISTFAATIGFEFLPFYIGKGVGQRCFELNRNETHRKTCQKLKQLGKEPKIIKIAENLTESEALQIESKLIDIFGLITSGGNLTNLDEGFRPNERRKIYLNDFISLRKYNKTYESLAKVVAK